MNAHTITVMLLSFGVLLCFARILGEMARKWRLSAVFGELLAGVLLGPTVLGAIAPKLEAFLFPRQGPNALILDGISTLAVVMFLMVAGMEVDISTMWRQGKAGFKVGVVGMVVPLIMGFTAAWFFPEAFGGFSGVGSLTFTLFFATALSISALPVIAKTLLDLDLYRSDMGMVVVSAAIFNDLIGWIGFAFILGLMDVSTIGAAHISITIASTIAFTIITLTVGRSLIHKTLPYLQAYTQWPGGELSFALILAIFGAAVTEWIGIHAIFGSFLAGTALGDSSHLRERTRVIINQFISFFFAPIFFAGIGLKLDFLAHFNASLVFSVFTIACVSKLFGATLGARWGKMSVKDAWAVGFAMNSRGAMEIILGLLALQAGIIGPQLFVALVVMAILTSMISGPAIRFILQRHKRHQFQDFLQARHFLPELKAASRREAIHEMAGAACVSLGLNLQTVESMVWEREEALSTGIGKGIALPNARIEGLREAQVVVGISDKGIDFDAPDDRLSHIIFLILVPEKEPGAQIQIISQIAKLFREQFMVDVVMRAKTFTDFLALINSVAVETASRAKPKSRKCHKNTPGGQGPAGAF